MQSVLLSNMSQAEMDWHFSDEGPFPVSSNTRSLFATEQIDPVAFGLILNDSTEYEWLVDQLAENSDDLTKINRFWDFLGQIQPEDDHPLPVSPPPLHAFAWNNPLPEPPEIIRTRAFGYRLNRQDMDEIRVFLDNIFDEA